MTKPSIRQGSDPLYFQQAEFSSPDVFHGFFSRHGGVSKDIYASLNCGMGSGDDRDNVLQNKGIVAGIAGCTAESLLNVHQVHSAECVVVDKPWEEDNKPKADAMVTDKPEIALGVLTADCAPVLFKGKKEDGMPVVGAAHAGWGGALKGVLEASVEAMVGLGARIETIQAVIGPCIGQASYEVSDDFAVPFLDEDDENERFFKAGQRDGHLMFDLPGYCAFKLSKAGLKSVFIKDLDTYFNEEDFFSYRRTTHRHEKDYGRQVSVIMIKSG